MQTKLVELSGYLEEIEGACPVQVKGRVTEVIGLVVRAVLPQAYMGELCLIYNSRSRVPVKAEVVGFQSGEVLLMPIGELANIGPESEVVSTGSCLCVSVGESLLGRVLNGVGEPMDLDSRGPLAGSQQYPIYAAPPDPLRRRRVTQPVGIGVRAIDGLLTCGEGQRIGLFAAAGVGKSTLLGMIARNTEADVNVIALVGERGREVRDFQRALAGKVESRVYWHRCGRIFPRSRKARDATHGLGNPLCAGAERDRAGLGRAARARGLHSIGFFRTAKTAGAFRQFRQGIHYRLLHRSGGGRRLERAGCRRGAFHPGRPRNSLAAP